MRNRTLARTVAATVAMGSLIVGSSGAASANDKTMVLKKADGTVVVKATWDDLTDNLCVIVYGSGAWGQVAIGSHYGLSEPDRAIRDATNSGGAGWYCTGNLSIREDALYDMQLRWESASGNWIYSKKETFYT